MMTQPQQSHWRRRILIALAIIAGLVIVLIVGVRLFSTAIVRSALERSLRTRASLDQASIGLYGESSAQGLVLFDGQEDQPMLRVEKASADLSMLGILSGHSLPGRLSLEGAQLDLRFNEAG